MDLKNVIIEHINPIGLIGELAEKSEDLQSLLGKDGYLNAEIYRLERRMVEIMFDARGVVERMTSDELKDPLTGRSNAEYTKRLVELEARKDPEYAEALLEVDHLKVERKRIEGQLESAKTAYSKVRYVSRLAEGLMKLESDL